MDTKKAADALKKQRLDRGWGIATAAKAIGISPTTLQQIERGDFRNLRWVALVAMSYGLRVQVSVGKAK